MNIFILSLDQAECARMHADQHVGKMLLEVCQLLCNAHPVPSGASGGDFLLTPWLRLAQGVLPYRHTHINHPCSVWVRQNGHNYCWLVKLAYELASEFEHRRDKAHGCLPVIDWCAAHAAQAQFVGTPGALTPFAQAMPEQYRGPDPVQAYRAYYSAEKRILRGKPASWTKRPVPEWF